MPYVNRKSLPLMIGIGAAALFVLAVVVGVAATRSGDGDSAAPDVVGDGIAHVHGLGVNPAGDDLYVATHHGVFRIGRDRTVRRVGDGEQDTMGFTVAGPDRFMASGHPDAAGFRRGQPPLLGLIESTNGGVTWESRSLLGQADFHSLAFAHDRIYGSESSSGRFMVSDDGQTWDTRSTQPLAGFAVDPADAAHVVAVGPGGLLTSTDGGRTWSPTDGPALAVLSWDADAGLFGVDAEGATHGSADGGATWKRLGSVPGTPEALLARGELLYAAAADEERVTGIYRSSDGGHTWGLYYRDGDQKVNQG